MSYDRFGVLKLTASRALVLVALPLACATAVTPELEGDGEPEVPAATAGTSAGGAPSTAGSSTLPTAGTTVSAGGSVTSNPFGGTASSGSSSGGKPSGGTSSAGASSGGTPSGGSAAGGKGGTAGAAGSNTGGSGGTGGASTGGCACPTKKVWADNTTLAFGPGDCLEVAGALYLYTGVKAQTWANKDCNPTMQAAWCTDVGADYKFMLCK